jgi:large repetitive protein
MRGPGLVLGCASLLLAACVAGPEEPVGIVARKLEGAWTLTAPMAEARGSHTATLLQSGQVLVTGGYVPYQGDLASAELYDPASGSWSTTDSLATAREMHTATLLSSGLVLVVGGPEAAELYDPSTGTWSTTGALAAPRLGHTATLLASGEVLVVGGGLSLATAWFPTSSELYDPTNGTWYASGSMAAPRIRHTATLLQSGAVLVAGGQIATDTSGTSFSPTTSAEVYDPASGTWSATGSLSVAHDAATATLLPSGQVLVAGGRDGSGSLMSVELYDPASGQWRATGGMATARSWHTAILLASGNVLVAGGIGNNSSAEVYDPARESWTPTGSLTLGRCNHTATLLLSSEVLVAGGTPDGVNDLASAELYEPAGPGDGGTEPGDGGVQVPDGRDADGGAGSGCECAVSGKRPSDQRLTGLIAIGLLGVLRRAGRPRL